MSIRAWLRDRLSRRRVEAEPPPTTPLSASYRWPSLEPEPDPAPPASGAAGGMNGATALAISNTYNTGRGAV